VYLALAFIFSISFAGAFKGVTVNFGLSNKLALNSPVVINFMISLVGYLGLLVTAPIFGQSVNQDFETRFQQVLFATPIRKPTYFFVRYLGSFLSTIVILSSAAIGVWLATLMPFVDRSLIAENHLWFYIAPYLSNVIPNTLIFGAIFIAVVAIYKKMAPVYVASIAVFTGWLIAQTLTQDLDNKFIAALIEPFGLEGTSQVTRYWSVAEQSSRVIPVTGNFLWNRLLWSSIGFVFLIAAYLVFDPFRLPKEKKRRKEEEAPEETVSFKPLKDLSVSLEPHSWKAFFHLALSECKQAFANTYFLMILLCGVLYLIAISGQVGKMFGTETLPVTYQTLEMIGGSFNLFVVILITFYSGELVWKDREQRVFELVDSKPVSDLFLYISKLLSLVLILLILSLIILVSCVLIQASKGYFNFEWPVYFQHLFVYGLPTQILTCVFALFVQTMARNKYVGHSIVILYFIALMWLPSLGLDHHLYLIGVLPHASYSDMNKFGTSLFPFLIFGLYWGLFHFVLAVFTVLFWRRGSVLTWKDRLADFKTRFKPQHKRALTAALSGWVLVGGFIFYNTNVLNPYQTKSEMEHEAVDYERTYKSFEKAPQPSLIAVNVQADIFPEERRLEAKGTLTYKNATSEPIKTVLVNLSSREEVLKLEWSKPVKVVKADERLSVKLYEFTEPLAPGEKAELAFEIRVENPGFGNSEFSKKIIQNGSFFYGGDYFPVAGYNSGVEIADDKTRRKYALPDRPRMADVNDPEAAKKTYISDEGNWIDFEATVSTSADQIAIAPGYLEKEWTVGDRHYFHYKMDRPILNFYAFQSARYEVVRDKWKDVKIEIYHHPGHTANIARMIKSIKESLDYFTKNFSPYQFRQARIIEFPRYQRFAQSFPNTIPYSESVGFIARVRDDRPDEVDYPFYVTSHEIAHQWWAHQVISGKMQGATMLSESLAQYSALMVQEHEYGPEKMKKFLKYELDSYLRGRSSETKKELPLMLNENQQYIHYNKGSVVFYALKDYLGEETVNKVLSGFLRDYAFKGPPFPKATELVQRFKAVAPPELKYLIEDLFETITFYDNRTESVAYHKMENGKYLVEVNSYNQKLRADESGRENEVPMDDRVDVGVFDKVGNLLYLQKHKVKSGKNTFRIEVTKQPAKAGVDPLNKLIDKVSDDNTVKAVEASSSPAGHAP
jgi:hypothetical protein